MDQLKVTNSRKLVYSAKQLYQLRGMDNDLSLACANAKERQSKYEDFDASARDDNESYVLGYN